MSVRGEQCEPAEELAQDQVEESDRHGRTSSLLSGPDAKPQVNLEDDDSGTYTLAGRYQTVTGRG